MKKFFDALRLRRVLLGLAVSWLATVDLCGGEVTVPAKIFTPNGRPEWQWSVPVQGIISKETQNHPRAFLWIPPGCQRVRGVVVGQNNMEEEQIFEHPSFRRALTELDFAVVWATPPFDLFFRYDQGISEHFEAMMKALAAESGYAELALVPVVPLGHSAAASYPWHFGFWWPDRILAAVSVSGQWPYYRDQNTPDWGNRTLGGVPGLVTMGEYEAAFSRAEVGLHNRQEHLDLPLTMLAEPAGEHFAASDQKIELIGLYLRKAAQYRLPADWPIDHRPHLRKVDATQTGWLFDRAREDGQPTAKAAPLADYSGDRTNAFWAFDGELARAIEAIQSQHQGKRMQAIGYVQKAGVVAQRKSHVRVGLRVEIDNDDLIFKLRSTLLDTVPADWRGLKVGDPITHAQDEGKLSIVRICGPVEPLGPDTYALRFYRGGFDNPKRSGGACFIASHPGDETHKPIALEAEMKFWLTNHVGKAQQITFNAPESVPVAQQSLELAATSDAGLPVFFYVREGPAVVSGRRLQFTSIPPRARFPVKVTVVAWQWGRPFEPKIQSAVPVERTILITR